MDRRTYLTGCSLAGVTATTGCLTDLFDSTPDAVVLSEADDQLAESDALAVPAYGEQFPAFELPDATSNAVIDTESLERTSLVTTYFASCPAECGILLNHMAGIQIEINERGLAEAVQFLPITFDPARDDVDALRENAQQVGADLEAGNWYNLRPVDTDEAQAIVSGQLHIEFDRLDESDRMAGYDFAHIVLTWLVNPDGYVERLYRGEYLDHDRIVSDITTVAEAYESE